MCVPHNIVMGINNGVLIYFKIIKILNIYPSYLDEFFISSSLWEVIQAYYWKWMDKLNSN